MLGLNAAILQGPVHPLQLQLRLECEPALQQATQVPDTQAQADHTGLGAEAAMPAKVTASVTSASPIGVTVCMPTAQASDYCLELPAKSRPQARDPSVNVN